MDGSCNPVILKIKQRPLLKKCSFNRCSLRQLAASINDQPIQKLAKQVFIGIETNNQLNDYQESLDQTIKQITQQLAHLNRNCNFTSPQLDYDSYEVNVDQPYSQNKNHLAFDKLKGIREEVSNFNHSWILHQSKFQTTPNDSSIQRFQRLVRKQRLE